MVSFAPTSPETVEDQRRYTQARLVEVACLDCLAKVQVKKNSEHHTSIQWTQEAVSDCTTFAKMNHQEGGRPVHAGCPRLNKSIEEAVRDGAVSVGLSDD